MSASMKTASADEGETESQADTPGTPPDTTSSAPQNGIAPGRVRRIKKKPVPKTAAKPQTRGLDDDSSSPVPDAHHGQSYSAGDDDLGRPEQDDDASHAPVPEGNSDGLGKMVSDDMSIGDEQAALLDRGRNSGPRRSRSHAEVQRTASTPTKDSHQPVVPSPWDAFSKSTTVTNTTPSFEGSRRRTRLPEKDGGKVSVSVPASVVGASHGGEPMNACFSKSVGPMDTFGTGDDTGHHTHARQIRRSLHANMSDDLAKTRLPLSTKLIYCFPTISTLPVIVLLAAFGTALYELAGAELSLISACIAGARSLDVITDPAMSYITDYFRSPFGRRRPFMATGCWFYGLALVLLLTPPYGSPTLVGIWFACFYVFFFLMNTYCHIPYDALGPELTDNYEDRANLFFISGILDGLGTFIAVAMPVGMQILVGSININADICTPDGSSDNINVRCQAGKTCSDFVTEKIAFKDDPELSGSQRALLAGIPLSELVAKCDASVNIQDDFASLLAHEAHFCDCRITCNSACNLANQRTGFLAVGLFFGLWYIITSVVCVLYISERRQVEQGMGKGAKLLKDGSQEDDDDGMCEQASLAAQIPSVATSTTASSKSSKSTTTGSGESRQDCAPIVPTLVSTLRNSCFTVLLPAWVCDGCVNAIFASLLTFYVRYVIAPEFQTEEEHGRDCGRGANAMTMSQDFDRLCQTQTVLGACLCAALGCAVLAMPLWMHLVKTIGKVKAWLLWSLVSAATNILLVFPGRGDIWFGVAVAGLNGVPMSAKFLADAILADIIDYDEFLTGSRREATYTMFKSFLPKMMGIPAAAIPISLMNAFGHVAPKDGRLQEQPSSVPTFIKVVVGGFTCAISLLAFYQKRKFPLVSKEQNELVAEGIAQHLLGKPAKEPITGAMFSIAKFNQHELPTVWALDHFPGVLPIQRLQEDEETGLMHLLHICRIQTLSALVVMVASVMVTVYAFVKDLMNEPKLSFIPTLSICAAGFGVVCLAFCIFRQRAAKQLRENPPSQQLLEKVVRQRQAFANITTASAKKAKAASQLEKRVAAAEERALQAELLAQNALQEVESLRMAFQTLDTTGSERGKVSVGTKLYRKPRPGTE